MTRGELRTKDVVKDALRGEDKRPEWDPGIPQSQERPAQTLASLQGDHGIKEIGHQHQMHALVFGFF